MFYFVTGTDTDSGKTLIASALLAKAKQQGLQTLGVKPIASGCELVQQQLQNSDALALRAQSSLELPYAQSNPFAFAPAIAPHIAAANQDVLLTVDNIHQALMPALAATPEFGLIEGAGGWRLPLGQGHYLSELVQQLELPVILVVGMKLGCLNHAVLTQEAILADGLTIAGWVANRVDPNMSVYEENLESLKEMMCAPMLGEVPYLGAGVAELLGTSLTKTEQAAHYLQLPEVTVN